MLALAGFDISTLQFSDIEPFWTFSVKKHAPLGEEYRSDGSDICN
jgi:hypothetical protein